MSYFQKYQKSTYQSPISYQQQSSFEPLSSHDFRKNNESRQSYLKAFKKYYIDKLINQKTKQGQHGQSIHNKQNFQPQHQIKPTHKEKSLQRQSVFKEQSCQNTDYRINPNKIVTLVNNNDNHLQELLYSSISQLERQMLGSGQSNDLLRENKILKGAIQKLKALLKQKLEVALKKNKQEITLMFEQYSTMIKKLLEDKQKLTNQLQSAKKKFLQGEFLNQQLQREYEDKIRVIVDENNTQISSTKQQIEEFLEVIVQYEEEAGQEKQQLDKLREKVVQLELENGQLRKQTQFILEKGNTNNSHELSSMFEGDDRQIECYAEKIENLLSIVDKLQEENNDLNRFLKSCKCSKIKSRSNDSFENEGQSSTDYDKKMINLEKGFIREEMGFRQALKKKDQCIQRLNLVIEQMRRGRYESVDRMTEQAVFNRLPR